MVSGEMQFNIVLLFVISKRGTSGALWRMGIDFGELLCCFTRSAISNFEFATSFGTSVTEDDFVYVACQNSCKLFSTFLSRTSGVVDSDSCSSAIT